MPRAAVILALLVALALGTAVLLTAAPTVPPGVAPPVLLPLDLPVDRINTVRISWPDGSNWEFRKLTIADEWTAARSGEPRVWRGEARYIIGFLRLLAQAPARSGTASDLNGPTIDITSTDGSKRTITMGEQALGGSVPARLTANGASKDVSLPSELAELVKPAGVSVWRSSKIFVADLGDPTEVTLKLGTSSLTLTRGATGWSLTPGGPADRSLVEGLLKAAQSLSMRSLLDTSNADATGVAAGDSLTIRSELRTLDRGQLRSDAVTQELKLGASADAANTTRFGQATVSRDSASSPLWGPSAGIVSAEDLKGLSTDPTLLASRRSAECPASDIARLIVHVNGSDITLTRNISGWTVAGDADAIAWPVRADELLDLLTKERAVRVASKTSDAPTVRVELFGPGNTSLGEIGLRTGPTEGSKDLAITASNDLYDRTYGHLGRTDHLTAWIARFAK